MTSLYKTNDFTEHDVVVHTLHMSIHWSPNPLWKQPIQWNYQETLLDFQIDHFRWLKQSIEHGGKTCQPCNGFTTGGINELVILAYSSNKLVTVPPRSLYKNTTVQSHGVIGYSSCHMSGAEVWCYSQTIFF